MDIETQPTSDDNKADINVTVTEKSTGYFNVGLGYSTVNGALVRTGVTENNFMGKGQQLGFDLGISERSQDYNINFTEPYFLKPSVVGRRRTCLKTKPTIRTRLLMTKTPWAAVCVWDGNIPTTFIRASAIPCVRMRSKNVHPSASVYIQEEEGKYVGSSVGQTFVL